MVKRSVRNRKTESSNLFISTIIISLVFDNYNHDKGIITNSYLDKDAFSYSKRYKVIVVDRDTLIDMMIFNLKHK